MSHPSCIMSGHGAQRARHSGADHAQRQQFDIRLPARSHTREGRARRRRDRRRCACSSACRRPILPAGTVKRTPLHLALVLDRSGSMNGAPLEEAKRCARNIIDSLAPGDRAAIFAFDDEVERVAPLTPASDKLALSAALAAIGSGGSTNLHGGWRAGADELASQLAGDDVHRVILLSDGGANAGETDLEAISGQCKVLARSGVSTSTYGLGNDFNEELMLAMASAGRGNAYYGQTAADLAEPFAAEFALLDQPLRARVGAEGQRARGCRGQDSQRLREGRRRSVGLEAARPRVRCRGVGAARARNPAAAGERRRARRAADHRVGPGGDAGQRAALPDVRIVSVAGRWTPQRGSRWPATSSSRRRMLELDAGDALEAVRVAIAADDWQQAQELVDDRRDAIREARVGCRDHRDDAPADRRTRQATLHEGGVVQPQDDVQSARVARRAVVRRAKNRRRFPAFLRPQVGAGKGTSRFLSRPCVTVGTRARWRFPPRARP